MRKIAIFLVLLLIFYSSANILAIGSSPGMLERIREKSRISVEEFEKNRAELKNLMEQNQTEFRNRIENKKEELKKKLEQNRIELKNRLRVIKNEQKQKIVERIYEQIAKLNEIMTDHYLSVIENLEIILEKIENRTAKAKFNGKNVELAETAIAQAKTLIENAKDAIKNQAEKVYEPPKITDEQSLRLEVGKLRNQLHQDLKSVEQEVKNARDAIKEAALQLAKIPKVDELEIENKNQ